MSDSEWKPGDPIYPFEPDYAFCADPTCGALWTSPGTLPDYCPECGGPALGASVEQS